VCACTPNPSRPSRLEPLVKYLADGRESSFTLRRSPARAARAVPLSIANMRATW